MRITERLFIFGVNLSEPQEDRKKDLMGNISPILFGLMLVFICFHMARSIRFFFLLTTKNSFGKPFLQLF